MKKILIPVLTVSVAVFSAFATRPTVDVFAFTSGSSTVASDRVNPNNYTLMPPTGCSAIENELCSIEAVADGNGKPIIATSSALYSALHQGGSTTPDFGFLGIQGKP